MLNRFPLIDEFNLDLDELMMRLREAIAACKNAKEEAKEFHYRIETLGDWIMLPPGWWMEFGYSMGDTMMVDGEMYWRGEDLPDRRGVVGRGPF